MAAGSFTVGWRQVAASVITLALTALITGSYSILAVPLGEEFQPSRMVLMLAMTLVSAVSAVLSPIIGKWLDRADLRIAAGLGAALLAAGYVAISFAPSFNVVLALYGLLIAPASTLLGPLAATVLLSRWFVKRRGTALGIAIAGIAGGNFLFPPLIQAMLGEHEWRTALQLVAVMVLVLGTTAAALIVNRPAERGLYPDGADAEPDSADANPNAAHIPTRTIIGDPSFWLIGIVVATVTAGLKGMVTNLGSMANDVGIDRQAGAALLSMYAVSGFVSKLAFATFSDRIRPHLTMIGSLIGYGCGTLVMAFAADSYVTLVTGVCLMGFFGGMMMPMESYLVPRLFGREVAGRVGGLLNLLLLSFLLVSPPLFGFIFDRTGSYAVIFMVFTGLAVVSMALVRFIRTEPRRPSLDGAAAS
ncbi:MFS transporter [Novosphingobium sp. TH158]|uniref:MFS transporter n=1 Tax=Novosphingobium sp. TH158 TaxID=2067455 RepID=UPI000C7BCAD9|nr:MFS transporter [Novosphingobium sp. TH158]PLK25999.1 MFS transporter [Novosphingobium sp. TH158]